jgi:hypothetical protein
MFGFDDKLLQSILSRFFSNLFSLDFFPIMKWHLDFVIMFYNRYALDFFSNIEMALGLIDKFSLVD